MSFSLKLMSETIPDNSPIFQHPLVLFDGICNLCDRTVNFIIKRDPDEGFRFIPLQSPLGKALLAKFGFPTDYRESFVLIDDAKPYTKSTAFIRISKKLSKPWPLCSVAAIIPRSIRDFIYTNIGKNRYRWFGKHDYCEIRSDSINHRFITDILSADNTENNKKSR